MSRFFRSAIVMVALVTGACLVPLQAQEKAPTGEEALQRLKQGNARFAADKRVSTEHAQLDDNGDGVGTEEPVVEKEGDKKPTADGQLAARTFLPFRKAKK